MRRLVEEGLLFLQARWRWIRGRCPRCNRNLYAVFPYFMANDPHCPVCKDETETDLRMWHKHQSLIGAKEPQSAGVPE